MEKITLIEQIAKMCQWHKTVNDDFINKCEETIEKLQKMLPSGSGIDSGCKINIEKSGSDKVIIDFGYHHMNEDGYYDGWTYHSLIIKPELYNQFSFRITGRDRNFVKDYLYEMFDYQLRQMVDYFMD